MRLFERATVVVLAVLTVATLVRFLANDLQQVAASKATWGGGYYLSSSSEPRVAPHNQ